MALSFAIFLAFASLAVVVAIAESRRRQQSTAGWGELAARLGLHFSRETEEITGTLDDLEVRVRRYATKPRTAYVHESTIFEVQLNDLPAGLELRPEGLAIKGAKLLGGGDVATGLADIDDDILVWASAPADVKIWASNMHVAAALRALVRRGSYELSTHVLTVHSRSVLGPERLEAELRELVQIGNGLRGRAGADRRLSTEGVPD